jgi:hypothetical protein
VETIIKVVLRGGKNSKRIKKIGILWKDDAKYKTKLGKR